MQMNQKTRQLSARTQYNASAEQELRRAVLSCLLWEDQFYESGVSIAQRISDLCKQVRPEVVASLAQEARSQFNLRHVPLLLLRELAAIGRGRSDNLVSNAVANTIQRADELSELVSIYWSNGKRPLSKQLKKGLGQAFRKFDAYQLAKYDREKAVRLRDVLFLTHPKADNPQQQSVWDQLVAGTLPAPDTWEVALSGGADKKATFERLIREGNLGYLALLRNLRNMEQAGVDRALMREAILARRGGANRVLPFRFVAAARAAPSLERELDQALVANIKELPELSGRTLVLVDISGSMFGAISGKSDLTKADAAATLASVINAEDLRVWSFSDREVEVPARKGMAGVDAILRSQRHSGTNLAGAIEKANAQNIDRLIVITDEQDTTGRRVPAPVCDKAYMINVASYRNGVGYGKWTHIDGFSENVIRFIHELEAQQ